MRFHLLGLAHIKTLRENSTCAYTQKIIKLARILKNYGHTVFFYGVEGSSVLCDELVEVIPASLLTEVYGEYDYSRNFFVHNPNDKAHREFSMNAIEQINKRKNDDDILLCTMGNYQKSIADGVSLMTCEPGIGYSGVFSEFKVFESYAWMHYVYGLMGVENGLWYDAVIPNYYDPDDFPYSDKKEDYLLYIGRIIGRKGVSVASEIAKSTGNKLYVVGQGDLDNEKEGLHLSGENHIIYKSAVGPKERGELMKNAKAVLVPTLYLEPFGGVNVEAQLCGTPVITTDWGAFPETVLHGTTGFRCRTFEEFCWAVNNVHSINPEDCRYWAENNYSIDRIGAMYQEYFTRLYNLFDKGWYQENDKRKELSYNKKYYPGV